MGQEGGMGGERGKDGRKRDCGLPYLAKEQRRFAETMGFLILLAVILGNNNFPLLSIFYSPKSNTQDESPQA